ncbi:MAG: DUF1638 domain-containing protein [Lentisphaeria bacterium]
MSSEAQSQTEPQKIAVVACGVLEWNIKKLADRISGVEFVTRFLPAQLHNNPGKLRDMLQEVIDELDSVEGLSGICLGFGVCGRGTIGLQTRSLPLIIPRAQDCIGIFLGSHSRYLAEFKERPGTRYMTHGWYDKTVKDVATSSYMDRREEELFQSEYDQLVDRYGEENASFISAFRESWKRNYQRAAYIRFPAEEEERTPPGQELTEAMAGDLGWDYQVLEGDESMLEAMLSGHWQDARLLLVPAHSRTVRAPGNAVIGFTSGADSKVDKLLAKYEQGGDQARTVQRTGVGLGIDTGGTFTDAVIYDFDNEKVIASAKAPTIHEKLVRGIENVLQQLPAQALKQVSQAGVSTTLATNAFVEKKGRKVALLIMSPFMVNTETLQFNFVKKVKGCITMEGEESESFDPVEIKKLAREAVAAGCEAFAVSGFGSVVNPAHELNVAKIAFDETGLHSVCGHELTSHLNFIERATTAAMNAKLVPLIENLLESVRRALKDIGLGDIRMMVVKGDGSQMLDKVAREFPVETVLSGPAASVVGAARLFREKKAVVADMGGTTLDVAVLRDGFPVLSDRGARIGEFQTSVRAMAVRTIGLGGDSAIDLADWPKVKIGPRRVRPICRLSDDHPNAMARLDSLFQQIVPVESNILDFVALAEDGLKQAESAALNKDEGNTGSARSEKNIIQRLKREPMFLVELANAFELPGPDHIRWQGLESAGLIVRYGLTLTDILHFENKYAAFDVDAARNLLQRWSLLLDVDPEEIISAVYREFRASAANEIMGACLPDDCPWDITEAGLRSWLTNHLADLDERPEVSVGVTVKSPLIPVGAPSAALFPDVGTVLKQKVLLSEYAGVTNALGAIAGNVVLRETAFVRVTEDGALLCSWRGGNVSAVDLENALRKCESALTGLVKEAAAANGVTYQPPMFTGQSHQAETRDGTVFLGISMSAELRG